MGDESRPGFKSGQIGDVDDHAFARGQHTWSDGVGAKIGAIDADPGHTMPVVMVIGGERCFPVKRSAVDEDIDAPQALFRQLGHCLDLLGVGDVGPHRECFHAQRPRFIRRLFSGLSGRMVVDDDVRSRPRKGQRDSLADAMRTAGDECCFSAGVHGVVDW